MLRGRAGFRAHSGKAGPWKEEAHGQPPASRGERPGTQPSLAARRRSEACQRRDLDLLAFGTERMHLGGVKGTAGRGSLTTEEGPRLRTLTSAPPAGCPHSRRPASAVTSATWPDETSLTVGPRQQRCGTCPWTSPPLGASGSRGTLPARASGNGHPDRGPGLDLSVPGEPVPAPLGFSLGTPGKLLGSTHRQEPWWRSRVQWGSFSTPLEQNSTRLDPEGEQPDSAMGAPAPGLRAKGDLSPGFLLWGNGEQVSPRLPWLCRTLPKRPVLSPHPEC